MNHTRAFQVSADESTPTKRSHLGRKLGLAIGLLVAVFAAGGALLAYVAYGRREAVSTGRSVSALGAAIAGSYEVYDPMLRKHPATSIAESLATRSDVARIEITGHDGKPRWSSRSEAAPLLSPELVVPLVKPARCTACHESEPNPIGEIRIATNPVVPFGGVSTEALAILFLGAALLTVFVLILVERFVLVRLSSLVRVMELVERGDPLARADADAPDEIGRLAGAVNRLLGKVAEAAETKGMPETISEIRGVDEIALRAEIAAKTRELETRGRELEEKTRELEAAHGQAVEMNARLVSLNDQVALRLERLRFLYKLFEELRDAAGSNIHDTLGLLSVRVHQMLGVPETSVLLFEGASKSLELVGAHGFTPGQVQIGKPLNLEGTVSREAIDSGKPVYVPDLSRSSKRVAYRTDSRGSILCVPIFVHKELRALLHFSSPQPDAFSEDERELLISLGHQATIALRNAPGRTETQQTPSPSPSSIDESTGLLSRVAVLEQVRELSTHPDGLSVILFDIPGLRTVTEILGAPATDEILKGMAEFLRASLPSDNPIGRYGIDQFLLVLPGMDDASAGRLAAQLQKSVLDTQAETGVIEPVKVVAGHATLGKTAATWQELPTRAAVEAHRAAVLEQEAEDLPEVDAVLVPEK